MNFKETLMNFKDSFEKLTYEWENMHKDSPEYIALTNTSEKYPFHFDPNALSYSVHTWVSDTIEEIEYQEMQKLFEHHTKKQFVMATKNEEINNLHCIESFWFYETELSGDGDKINVTEPISGIDFEMSFDNFKDIFVIVSEDIYNMYMTANGEGNGEAVNKIKDIALLMGRRVGQ